MNIRQRAYHFAMNKHKNQKEDSGKPYMIHVYQVADILRMLTDDDDTIVAAYLHDTLEDTETTYKELKSEFGKKVADLVMEVTKDENKHFPRLKSRNAILIKFADRLSNMSRMGTWSKEKQDKYLKDSKFWKS